MNGTAKMPSNQTLLRVAPEGMRYYPKDACSWLTFNKNRVNKLNVWVFSTSSKIDYLIR